MSNIEENKYLGQMDVNASDKSANMPSSQKQEEAVKKKYGGMLPKKPPLISKDHERAYFDSADWALGKQGGDKPKGPLEALRPKLQPTQQQTRYRKSPYAPSGEGMFDFGACSVQRGKCSSRGCAFERVSSSQSFDDVLTIVLIPALSE
ncbi:hypothetical protein JHK85_044304 [Glycine max]|nr:hypothetical protein JHK86_043639 [Glycine max]KAG4957924.1 hypothetical protein JHK85_044304 [Glycine max]